VGPVKHDLAAQSPASRGPARPRLGRRLARRRQQDQLAVRQQFKIEVAAGRMQEPGGKQVHESWSQAELIQLKAAVDRHGRDWFAVWRDVGSKTRLQCQQKVMIDVAAGRMEEPGGKQVQEGSWCQAELIQLKAAVDRHGCDWVAVWRDVGSKTAQQCQHKVSSEIAAGRIPYRRVSRGGFTQSYP
jgi:hypothetical protein